MADFASRVLKVKTAVVIDDRTAYGQGVVDEFEKVAKVRGIETVGKEFPNSQATDFRSILTSIKVKNPDAIFDGGYDAQGAPMAKRMRALGLRAKLLGGDSICTAEMDKVAGGAAFIVYCAQGDVAPDKSAEGREYAKKYHDTFNTDLQVYGVNYYDGVKLLADAMVKAGTATDKGKLIAQLAKTNYNGIAGTYSFAEIANSKARRRASA